MILAAAGYPSVFRERQEGMAKAAQP